MGWVWLGQQGQRLSWSLASGVGAVALWWALRLVLAQRPPGQTTSSRHTALAMGLVTAGGAVWLHQAAPGSLAELGSLALAMVWAVWASALESHALRSPRCQRPWTGWPPLAAALLTWFAASVPGPMAGAVLLGAAALAWAAGGSAIRNVHQATPVRAKVVTLPATAMGWMMGTLWLSQSWCASAGWSSHTVVGLHLALMAMMPALVRLSALPNAMPPLAHQLVPLMLVALGGGLLWSGQALANGLVGMLLLALAWALPSRMARSTPNSVGIWTTLAGPLLLLAIGHWSTPLGPAALAWAYGALGTVAGALVMQTLWRKLVPQCQTRLKPH